MLRQIRPAILMTLVMTALCGLIYPLAMTGLTQLVFPHQANGSLVRRHGKIIGSSLIGQNFTAAKYFHPRPSATSEPNPEDPAKTIPVPYAADDSGASNLGPTSEVLIKRVRAAAAELHKENPNAPVPVDLVTTSASGLDPDITPAAALFQVPRVAKARHLPAAKVRALVLRMVRGRTLGLLGEKRVNVLALNLALTHLH